MSDTRSIESRLATLQFEKELAVSITDVARALYSPPRQHDGFDVIIDEVFDERSRCMYKAKCIGHLEPGYGPWQLLNENTEKSETVHEAMSLLLRKMRSDLQASTKDVKIGKWFFDKKEREMKLKPGQCPMCKAVPKRFEEGSDCDEDSGNDEDSDNAEVSDNDDP